jgi:hypothetical protein
MYNLVYEQLDQAKSVRSTGRTSMDEPCAGEIVFLEAEAFGEKVSKIVKHANSLLFVDEVGKNTKEKGY